MFRAIGVGLAAGAISALAAASAAAPSSLSVEDAVRIALASRAEIDAADETRRAADGGFRQATLRPNPVLSLQSENWRAWGSPGLQFGRDMNFFASVSQAIEVGGKRRARMDAAEADQATAEAERRSLEWAIETEVRQAFVVAAEARRRAEVLKSGIAPYEEIERYERSRLAEGAAAEIDVIRVEVERRQAELRLAEAETQAARASADLLRLMAAEPPAGELVLVDEVREIETEPPNLQEATAAALQNHPRLTAARSYAEQGQAAVEVERTLAKPDWTPYFGYKRDGPFDTLIGGVSAPLPLNNRNQGAIEAANAEQRRRAALVRALEAQVAAELRTAAGAWRRHAAIALETSQGPARRAREAREIAAAAYREQGVSLLFLLDAQRTETDAALLAARAVEQYRLSRAAFEAAAGTVIEGGAQ